MRTPVFHVRSRKRVTGVWGFTGLIFVGLMVGGTGQIFKPSPIEVVSSTRVGSQASGESLVEPHFAIDPGNGAHLVAAAMKLPTYGIAVFSSFDNGEHWVRHDTDHSDADP